MELSYTLTEEDVYDLQAQVLLLWRGRLLAGWKMPLFSVLLAGVIAMPLAGALFRVPRWWSPSLGQLLGYTSTLAFVALLLVLLLPVVRSRERFPLDPAILRRRTRAALKRSVLGPTRVRWNAHGIEREREAEFLRWAWTDVAAVLKSPRVISIRAKGKPLVIVIPVRAFADASQGHAAVREIEAASGLVSIEVGTGVPGPAVPKGRAYAEAIRPPALGVTLVLALLLFGQLCVIPWLDDPRRSNPPGKVVMYSTTWCPVCARLRECLKAGAVPFEERDIDRSDQANKEWSALDATGIPVLMVGKEMVQGIHEPDLSSLLASAGYHPQCRRAEN